VIVLSTGYGPATKQRCIDSVKAQKNACFEHVIVDAAEQATPLNAMENLYRALAPLAVDTVVVCLDLDDWFAHDRALETIQKLHDDGAWVTYGSYVFADGRPGHARPMEGTSYRSSPWLASHLKTFRAGLFQRIRPADLKHRDGLTWLYRAVDVATMFPVMEMAGPERVRFCPDILYVYNYLSAFEWSATLPERVFETETVKDIRARKPYERVDELC
jgi:hypothetical protein